MENQKIKQIENLENKNRLLTNEISQLNSGRLTEVEQNRIDGNFEEIEKNKQILIELKKQ
jgi:hypothetical protein